MLEIDLNEGNSGMIYLMAHFEGGGKYLVPYLLNITQNVVE
jgi:hypothetical protein